MDGEPRRGARDESSFISGQVEQHKKRSFQEELEQLFEKHGIKPDSRFWER